MRRFTKSSTKRVIGTTGDPTMPKLCSCFKGNKEDGRTDKKIKKKSQVTSNGKKENNLNVFLTGNDESGKTTLVKNLVAMHDPFTQREKIFKTAEIERYIRDSLTDIIRAFEQSDPRIPLEHSENPQSVTYMLTTAYETDFDYPLEFFDRVELLWADAGLQSFIRKFKEHRFPHSALYFLDHVSEIRDPDYVPSTEDMIHARLFPSPSCKMSFDLKNTGQQLNLIETDVVDKKQTEAISSLDADATAIVFITDCSDYDLITSEKGCQSRLQQSLDRFKTIQNNKNLGTIPVILLLNKQDLLATKIKINGDRLGDYFPDFVHYTLSEADSQNISSGEDPEVNRAKYFLRDQFLKVNPNCHAHFTCDHDLTEQLILSEIRKSPSL